MSVVRPATSGPAIVTVLLVVIGSVTACSGPAKPTVSPTRTLAAAKKQLDATSGVRIGLSTGKLPATVNGLLTASGVGTHDPAFDGAIKISAQGVTADAAVVAVQGKVYAKLPFTTTFVPIDPADYGAPDPARLMAPRGGLSSLLTAATGVKAGGEVRSGKTVQRSYRATVPGRAVATLIPSASRSASFDASFTVTSGNKLTRAVLTGPFYPQAKGTDVTYTVTFSGYGTHKDITAP